MQARRSPRSPPTCGPCLDPSTSAAHRSVGSEISKEKIGKYHASLLRTGDDKLLLLDDSGHLMLLDPNAKEYKEVARSKVAGETWAHPALSDGKLTLTNASGAVNNKIDYIEITPA